MNNSNAVKERNNKLKEPDEVAEAVMQFMMSDKPKLRYTVAPTKGAAEATIKTTFGRVVELNADQQFEFSRDEVVILGFPSFHDFDLYFNL